MRRDGSLFNLRTGSNLKTISWVELLIADQNFMNIVRMGWLSG